MITEHWRFCFVLNWKKKHFWDLKKYSNVRFLKRSILLKTHLHDRHWKNRTKRNNVTKNVVERDRRIWHLLATRAVNLCLFCFIGQTEWMLGLLLDVCLQFLLATCESIGVWDRFATFIHIRLVYSPEFQRSS